MKNKSLALLSLILLVPAPSLGTAAGLIFWPDVPIGKVLFFVAKIWLLGLPLVWLLWIDKGKLSWSKPTQGGFGLATVLGLAISGIIFLAYYIVDHHLGWIDHQAVKEMAAGNGLNQLPVYLGAVVYWVTLNSILEEYVWRWFVVQQCKKMMHNKMAIVVSAACFMIHHAVAMQVYFDWNVVLLANLGIFIGGATWSWLYIKYRSVWPGYVSHAIVDVAVFAIGYLLIFQ